MEYYLFQGIELFTKAINLTLQGSPGSLNNLLFNRGNNFKDLQQLDAALKVDLLVISHFITV